MKYPIYKTQLDKFQKSNKGKRILKQHTGKSNVSHKDFADFCWGNLEDSSDNTVACLRLASEEMQWARNGSPVIFLEDLELVEKLYRSKFSLDTGIKVSAPFNTFSISFPENTVIDGCEMTSCLVSITTKKNMVDMVLPPTASNEERTSSYLSFTQDELDEQVISVNYAVNNKLGGRTLLHLSEYDLDNKESISGEANALSILAKISISLCIYNSTTEGRKLISGFPESALSLPKGKSKVSYKGLTILPSEQSHSSKKSSSNKIKYRIPYFRNLRAERYYKGKHKNAERGSRWVLVREVDISGGLKTLLS